MGPALAGRPERMVAGFARTLRAAGMTVPTGAVLAFVDALGAVGLDRAEAVYWAGRATLVCRPEDVATFDRVFSSWWTGTTPLGLVPEWAAPLTLAIDDDDADPEAGTGDSPGSPGEVLALRWSAVEVLTQQDLASLTPEEWAEADELISALSVDPAGRPSRRTRSSRRGGDRPDLRATMRRNMRHGGVPLERGWRRPIERPRRMVFLLDVSGSMRAYSRALARFAQAAVAGRRAGRVEVFTIGTRLTRVTRQLGQRDPEAALRAAAASVEDWSGGTRLGAALAEFNDRWGVRGLARGAVVVICSDGWDRGDPDQMDGEMARLSRVAHRVIWVNPLKASPGYAPLARGMAAALPYVDDFVEGHSVNSLADLARRISSGPGASAVAAQR